MTTPAWMKSRKKEESTVYLDDDEEDIAAMFFAAGGGTPTSAKFSASGGAPSETKEDDDAAAMFHTAGGAAPHSISTDDDAGQESKEDASEAKDDDSSSSSSSGGSSDDSSQGSDKSGSSSGSSGRNDDDGGSHSSRGSASSGSSRSRSGGSGSGSDGGDSSQRSESTRSSGSSSNNDDDDRSRSDESGRSSRSSESSRSSRSGSSRSASSRSATSRGGEDEESRSNSSNSGSEKDRSESHSDNGSRSSRSSRSSASSRSRSRSNSASSRSSDSSSRSGEDGSRSDSSSRSSRSSRSDSGSSASGEADSTRGSDASSSYEEIEIASEDESETKEDNKAESKDSEMKESTSRAQLPIAKFPKPVNTTPVKSFPKVVTSTPTPIIKAPDVKAKPAFASKPEGGLAPWQNELKKRKETGASVPGWKKPKQEKGTIYVDEEDEDDIAAMFFDAGGGKPKSAKFSFGTGAATSASSGSDDDAAAMFRSSGQTSTNDDAAAMFRSAGQTSSPDDADAMFSSSGQSSANDDAAAMFRSTGQTSENDDPAAMFRSAGQTPDNDDAAAMFRSAGPPSNDDDDAGAMFRSDQTGTTPAPTPMDQLVGGTNEYVPSQTENEEPIRPVNPEGEQAGEGGGQAVPGDSEELEVIEEVDEIVEVEEIEDMEEEFIMEEVQGVDGEEEMVIEVEEEYMEEEFVEEEFVDEEFVDEETVGASNEEEAARLTAELVEQQALEERRLAQQKAYEEMERVESQMRNYIASLNNNEESAQSVHSDQSSVPWAMVTTGDHEPVAVYGRYIQSARERRMDDQSSYFKPDMEITADDSIAETDTLASSEQRSIPWGLEVREGDSWANPVRPLQTTKKTVVHPETEVQQHGTRSTINTSMSLGSATNLQSAMTLSSISSKRVPNRRKRRKPTGFGEMVSAEVFKSSVPNPERETELWYHPGFAFLAQNPNMRPFIPPPVKLAQSPSLTGSEATDKAIVSDLEITERVYNTSVPSVANGTLLSYGEKTNNQWNLLESPDRSEAESISSSRESSENRHRDFRSAIMRTASPWTKNGNASTSSESLSHEELLPFEDEGSNSANRRKIVFSRSGSTVSIDLDVETFEYVPESFMSMRQDSEASTFDTESVKSVKPRGLYGFMACCFLFVLVPASVGIFFLTAGQRAETAPTSTNTNFNFPTLAPFISPSTEPTMAPSVSNKPIDEFTETPSSNEETTDAPSSVRFKPTFRPTSQPTIMDPIVEEDPVTEDLLFRLLASASVDSGEALRNRKSPQHAAMEWLRTPDGFNEVRNDDIFLQRYALATLYYSTAGESWTANDRWLSAANACDWFSSGGSLLCDNEGMITSIMLTNNGLNGNLPNEIGILSQLQSIMLSGNSGLTGPIPSSLRNLSNLRSVYIEGTGLSALPPEICELPLVNFWANCEEIGCTCCDECFF